MDFFYYNKQNEKVKLDINVGTNWKELNVQNQQLNSIFAKVDDGDGSITDTNELNLLQKLLKKADGIINSELKNGVLENEELDEILKQINEEEIELESAGSIRQFKEHVVHDKESFTKEEYEAIRHNETDVDTIRQKYINKIKEDLKKYHKYDERFPEDRYEIEVTFNGKYYESFVYDKVTNKTYQGINDLNGIIDESDFSEEDLKKLEAGGLLYELNIDRAQGRLWTPELSKIVASILHNVDLDEKTITVSLEHWGGTKNLVYDVENKTIKMSNSYDNKSYSDLKKIKFDENGRVLESQTFSTLGSYRKDDKTYKLGYSFTNWLAAEEGLTVLQNEELSDEQIKLYKEIAKDIDIYEGTHQYQYDENGNEILSRSYMNGKIFESTKVNGVEYSTVTDKNGNFISRTKYSRQEEGNALTLVQEELDEHGNLISKTTQISTTYEEPMILNRNGNKYTQRTGETKTIKEFPDGRIEEEVDFDDVELEELVINEGQEYEDISFTGENGIKFEIKNKNSYTAEISMIMPNGKTYKIQCEGEVYGDKFHDEQLPKLKNILNKLPLQVFEDLSNEISDIKLMDDIKLNNGHYVPNTNVFEYNLAYKQGEMSFVHEIGHAIDNINGDMWSKNPKFSGKFARLKELANKLINHDKNHALELPEEFFASCYADFEYPNGKNNHIKALDNLIMPLKDSQNAEEIELYNLYIELKNDVKTRIKKVRKQSQNKRMDNTITNLVKTELKDIIEILNEDK